ncbi:hypothetical protein GGF44_005927 [Coemansia sp. RSA 1694]|nr:hypothetical protein GGF44_005927 [Coemansia sp. RSA 1694]
MWMEFPKETSMFAEDKSFMVGSAILVVPATDADISQPIDVRLPTQENWYDMRTHATYIAPLKRQFALDLATTLVFARGGSIVPTRERHRGSSALMRRDPITLYVYVSRTGTATGSLYLDDGETYSYQDGAFIERELSFENAKLTSRPSPRTASSPEQLEFLESMSKVRVERIVVVGMRNALTNAAVVENGQTRDIALSYAGSKIDSECVIRNPAVLVGNDWEITLG